MKETFLCFDLSLWMEKEKEDYQFKDGINNLSIPSHLPQSLLKEVSKKINLVN